MVLSKIVSFCVIIFICLFVFFIWPTNKWHKLAICEIENTHKFVIALTIVSTILICVLPMSLSPYWNGSLSFASDKQQYGRLADALLEGHLYIDNGDIDPALEAMENPYDTEARNKLGVKYHWDEVYYHHHYYTYFGIVPTVILFIPYKLLTGNMLLSHQATQIFAILFIVGLFYLFYMFCKLCFPKFPFSLYLLLSVTLSVLSVGYSIAAPALYCTAIISAICLMVWSFIFFIKAVWNDVSVTVSQQYLFVAGLLGAMAFGCRPPVALANSIVIAILLRIRNSDKFNEKEKIKAIICLLSPYFLIGFLLMAYNYARFDNIFEFGVSYQLTITDQHLYQDFWKRFDIKRLLEGFLELLFGSNLNYIDGFPFVNIMFWGVFVKYPILLLTIHLFSEKIMKFLKSNGMLIFIMILNFTLYFISINDIYWTPVPIPRYQLDFTYLLCIVTFVVVGAWISRLIGKARTVLIDFMVALSFYSLVIQFLLFCIPFDVSYTMCSPEILLEIQRGLLFDY